MPMNTGAMKADGRLPAVDAKKCKRCGKCIEACPIKAILESSNNCCAKCIKYCITLEVPCSPEYIVFDYEKCDACGSCISACPHEAITWYAPKTG